MDEIVATPTETIASADIAASLSGERAADMVEALNALPPATAAEVLLYFPVERAVEVLDQPGLDYDSEIVQNLPVERAVPVLSGMAADRVADVFRRMAEPARSEAACSAPCSMPETRSMQPMSSTGSGIGQRRPSAPT